MSSALKLLAALALLVLAVSGANAQCEMPPGFSNLAVVEEGDLRVSFASDKEGYSQGETAQFCLIVQNLGSTTFSINWGTEPQDGLFVLTQPCTNITLECFYDAVFIHPRIVHYFSPGTTLPPGACRVWMRVWNTAVFPAPDATYNVLGGMFDPHPGFAWPVGRFRVPSGGVLLQVALAGSTPVASKTWGRIKSQYMRGIP